MLDFAKINLNQNSVFTEVKDSLSSADIQIGFWGDRIVTASRFKPVHFDFLLQKILEVSKTTVDTKNAAIGIEITKRLSELNDQGNQKLKNANFFTRLICFLREFWFKKGYSRELHLKQAAANFVQNYGSLAKTKGLSLGRDLFGCVLSFLTAKELEDLEKRVCTNWDRCIESTMQWRSRCEILLDVSGKDLQQYLPKGLSFKESYRLMTSSIIGRRVYDAYIGNVGPVPKIPREILRRWNEQDPCDQTKTIGDSYVLMYYPSYIETEVKGFSLDKPDDPNDIDAPKLIPNEAESENSLLKVPVTINNIEKLFMRPKKGNSSNYSYTLNDIGTRHGDKRTEAGWVCMRKNVIGKNRTFLQQQLLASENGVCIVSLQERIFFNFIEHARSGKANVYPDGEDPLTLARTSTLMDYWPLECGLGNPFFGLYVDRSMFDYHYVGVGVALPSEVRAIDP